METIINTRYQISAGYRVKLAAVKFRPLPTTKHNQTEAQEKQNRKKQTEIQI